jgi:diguanylate cyclase (GGDEF)-like protein
MEPGGELPARITLAVFAMDVRAFDDFDAAIAAALALLRERLARQCRFIVRHETGDWIVDGVPGTKYRRVDERRFVAADGRTIDAALAVDLVRRDGVRDAAIVISGGDPSLSASDRALVETTARLLTSLFDADRKAAEAVADAQTDPLTGLQNRRGWTRVMNILDESLRDRRSAGEHRGYILVIDIDGLKEVNDARGHAAGDDLLNRAASALRTACKDMPPARTGGDEFTAWTFDRDETAAQATISSLYAALAAADVRATIGWAPVDSGKTVGQISAEADRRMYAERRRKRST